jgi:hypothetical protein
MGGESAMMAGTAEGTGESCGMDKAEEEDGEG